MSSSQMATLPPEIKLMILEYLSDLPSATNLAKTCKDYYDIWTYFNKTICRSILPKTIEHYHEALSLIAIQQHSLQASQTTQGPTTSFLHNAKEIERACSIVETNPFVLYTSPAPRHHFLPRAPSHNGSKTYILPLQKCHIIPHPASLICTNELPFHPSRSAPVASPWHLHYTVSGSSPLLSNSTTIPLCNPCPSITSTIAFSQKSSIDRELCAVAEISAWVFHSQEQQRKHPEFEPLKGGITATARGLATGVREYVWESASWVLREWAMRRVGGIGIWLVL
ncbi:MAG: hypothetical protein Q9168_007590 [Polycauliona sp. 1 TL-2023]